MMATPKGAGFSRNRRVTTYSKAFGRRSRPEEKGKDGRSVTAPLESSTIWDFHDDDEISSPVVTVTKPKSKQYGYARKLDQHKARRATEAAPKPAPVAKSKVLPDPKRRRTSPSQGESRGFRARAYSTPPSPPPSLPSPPHEAMPPPKSILKTSKPRSILRVSSSGSTKTATKETTVKDAPARSAPFSPAIPKNLKTLNINRIRKEPSQTQAQTQTQTQIPFRPGQTPRSFSGNRQEKASGSKMPGSTTGDSQRQQGSGTRKRKRLIDELAAQADDSSDEGDDTIDLTQDSRQTPEPQDLPTFPSTPEPKIPKGFGGRPESAKKRSGPKVTYSARRTLLAEGSSVGGLETVDEDAWLKQPLIPTGGSQFDMDDDDDDEPFTKGAVRSIHELRQAGANSRFADEIEDLLTRIGRPSGKTTTGRRNALVELSQKLSDKSFVRKFRDHNGDRSLFEQVGKETDIIAGYALVAILTTLLASTASTHIMSQLQGQGFSLLLRRLLAIPEDIQPISKDRANNLSRNGQQAMSKLKASLLILPIWEPTTPFMLSPRRLALKALELVVKHSGPVEGELFSSEVTDQLFSLLADAEPDAWKYPRTDESVDFHLALSLLESYSVQAMQTESKDRWTFKHLPIIADTLGTTLRRGSGRLGEVGLLVLKLTLNTANNNHDAATAFIEKGTVHTLANALCDTFQTATTAIEDTDLFNSHLESLLLMLGVMINFSEHDRNTGGALLNAQDDNQAPLDRLIRLFLNHHEATSEADSVEKSQLNVAFGYLSLLLGYMSLYEPVRKRFSSMHKGGNLAPLLVSIREFIAYHRMTDDAIAQAGDGQAPLYSSFTTKLQGLVERLESYA